MKWMRMRPSDEAGVTRLIQQFFFSFNVGRLPPIQYHTFANLQEQAVSAFVSPRPVFISPPLFFLYRCETLRCAFEKKKKENPKVVRS